MNLQDGREGHRNRIKEKYLENSANLVYDYEVLELLLTYAIPRRDVKPVAKALLERFGSIKNVLEADKRQLCTVKGIGPNAAILITLVKDIQIRSEKCRNSNVKCLNDYSAAAAYFKNALACEQKEVLMLVSLDNANRIISSHILAKGDINHIDVNPREIMETVLLDNASRVIIAHNHPSGSPEPSARDIDFTLNLRNILSSINVRLSDHIIVSSEQTLSMCAQPRYSRYFAKESGAVYR